VAAAEGLGEDPQKHLALAVSETDRLLEIGDPTGLAHMIQGAILLGEGKTAEALQRVETAEISRPTCDITFAMEGSIRRYLGQWEKSVGLLDKAMRLSPVNKPWYPTVQACALYIGGRVEQAAATAEEVLEHQPHNLEALLVLAAAQKELGLERRARATAEMIKERFSGVDVEAWLDSNPYQDSGLVERWRKDLTSVGVIA
jgi:tetratricopeptide (TPR) repeat protein